MSRYTGPRVKIMRALHCDLPGLSAKTSERRPYPPGEHGQDRKKVKEYGLRLMEKQKLRMNYGLTERQLKNVMRDAKRSKMAATDKLLELLERRLDNVVFRAGFARTIPAARQLVTHGHVLVDGHRVDIASYRIRPGQKIQLKVPKKMGQPAAPRFEAPPWLSVNREQLEAQVNDLPTPETLLFRVNTQLIIEFYSQMM